MSAPLKITRDDIMGMPISVEIVHGTPQILEDVFSYFQDIDERFSTYKPDSEISKINTGLVSISQSSNEMQEIFSLAQLTTDETQGFFSITKPDGTYDPSGIVKGWSIQKAANILDSQGVHNYFLDVGGDIQSKGNDPNNMPWTVGIRNPFQEHEIIKVLTPNGSGIATSGTSVRGQHIYNPHRPTDIISDIVSITVIGPNIYEADRFATAAFAMGNRGITFIENLPEFEAYQIDAHGIATMTSNLNTYTL